MIDLRNRLAGYGLAMADPIRSEVATWLAPVAMWATQDLALRCYFKSTKVLGIEHLPRRGPVLLAPTHRSRWDALMLPMAAGRRIHGRDCRFMVTTTEMEGLQGWFLERLGCFAIDQSKPGTSSLRFALDLLGQGEQVVVFPEGTIRRDQRELNLEPGLPRLASLAQLKGLRVPVVPVGLAYSHPIPRWWDRAALCFGAPLLLNGTGKTAAAELEERLAKQMRSAEEAARTWVGNS